MTLYRNACRQVVMKGQQTGANWATGGTYAAADFMSLDMNNGAVNIDNREAYTGHEGPVPTQIIAAALKSATGSFSKRFNPATDGIILTAGLATPVTSEVEAGVVYSHLFTVNACIEALPGNFALKENRGAVIWEHVGLKCNTLTLAAAGEDQAVMLSGDLVGKSSEYDGITFGTGYTYPANKDLLWTNCTFSHNSGALGQVRNISFVAANNGLTQDRNGAATLSEPLCTSKLPTITFDLYMEGSSWHGLQRGATLQQFIWTITGTETIGAASNPSATITIPKLLVTDVKGGDEKTGLERLTITAEPVVNTTGEYYTLALVNTVSTYVVS